MARYELNKEDSFIIDINENNNYFVFQNDLFDYNEKNVIGLRKNAIINKDNKDTVEYKYGKYFDISPYLNKYDVYDSILAYLIDNKYEVDKIQDYINEDYFTFDMYLKLYSNNIKYPLPSKYYRRDFSKLLGQVHNEKYEEIVNGLYEKYSELIMDEQKKYFDEEERNLKANRDRICKLIEKMTLDLANLANKRNEVDEKVRKLK